jgi:hypothetical protein
MRLPDDGLAFIVLTNRYRVSTGRIHEALVDTFLPTAGGSVPR